MADAYEAFRECGWASWLCLLIAMVGITAGFVGVVLLLTRTRRFAWIPGGIALLLGLGSLSMGFLGQQVGLSKVEGALAGEGIDPSLKARIREEGAKEAGQCVKIGAGTGALPFLMGALAVAVGLTLRKKSGE